MFIFSFSFSLSVWLSLYRFDSMEQFHISFLESG